MKRIKMIALILMIAFCIDYGITQLLGFELIYARVMEMTHLSKIYAFAIGVCGFIGILSIGKEDDF